MKKSLLCLIVMALLMLPVLLTSCGDDMTAEDIANANFQKADKALTLSLWLPVPPTVDSDGDGVNDALDNRFGERLDEVEEKINDYLRTNNYCTEIEIVAVLEDKYYGELTDKFTSIKEIEKTESKAQFIADKYVNHAVKNEETQVFEMAYPELLDQQLDIFYVGGYDNFTGYIESGDVEPLNDFFSEGQIFNDLFKKIRSVYMDAMKVGDKYYGIPNNHIYAEKGQYILVNKELYDTYATDKWDRAYSLYDLKPYLKTIGTANLEGVIPYCGTVKNVPGLVYLDEENLIAAFIQEASVFDGKLTFQPDYLPVMSKYTDEFLPFYFDFLTKNNYVTNELADGQIAAVQFFEGNIIDIENIDNYYVIEALPPYANMNTVYSSMFAISTHTANPERAMQILYLLQENTEIRTLLQYGIEEEDYDLGNVNGETVIYTKNSGYRMDILYTGNCYRTYPASGVPMSYWDGIKELNLNTQLYPFFNYKIKFVSGGFGEEKMSTYQAYSNALKENNLLLKEMLETMDNAAYKGLKNFKKQINLDEDSCVAFAQFCKELYYTAK